VGSDRLRRGFHKEAEEYALEFRKELKLEDSDPLDPYVLAAHLEIPVRELLSDPAFSPELRVYFSGPGSDLFSAATVFDGPRAEIILNNSHHPNRLRSSLMHEIAHVLLGHPPRPPIIEGGCRHFDHIREKEANDLGWTILVPKRAALRAVENFDTRADACAFFKVSRELLEYRIRKCDSVRHAKNRKK
jgi:uncharacterized protein DUF955